MMRHFLLVIFLGFAILPALGQTQTDYYRLPDRNRQYEQVQFRYGGPTIRDRWYVALDGFVSTGRAHIDNSINGLINSDRSTRMGAGIALGWSYRERWAIEAGYARLPIQTKVSVQNGGYPLVYRYQGIGDGFVLRGKRRIFSTSGPWLRSGFWLTAGAWVIPNSGREEGEFELVKYRYRGQGETPDKYTLSSNTTAASHATAIAELGAEYNVRLSNNFDLGFQVRKRIGLSDVLTTDVRYTVNQYPAQRAQLISTGSGMTYGLTLRYTLSLRRNLPDVLEVTGKQRIR